MIEIVQMCLYAAAVLIVLAFVCDLTSVTLRHRTAGRAQERENAMVGAGVGGAGASGSDVAPGHEAAHLPGAPAGTARGKGLAFYGTAFLVIAFALLIASMIGRAVVTGHGPFSNQHEFAVAFTTGIVGAYLFFLWRYRVRALALVVLPIAMGMMLYALTTDSEVRPLIPALQNNLLLTTHVATAMLAYGAAAVASAAAVLYLVRPKLKLKALPSRELLDEIGYRAGVLTFPLLTIMILLGAIWAEIAWGRYWSWDPKETAALVTWLIYGAYLHARVVRDWRGTRAAWLLLVGFVAVLFTYFGNLFFGGLHSYV